MSEHPDIRDPAESPTPDAPPAQCCLRSGWWLLPASVAGLAVWTAFLFAFL